MSNTFPKANSNDFGYDTLQVDELVAKARLQFTDASNQLVAAKQLRSTEFDLSKGGYSISAVDSALDRLEDTFASREIKLLQESLGEQDFKAYTFRLSDLVWGRCDRPRAKRFASSGWLLRGYSKKQVDALAERVGRHISAGQPLAVDSVRRVSFRSKRGGYSESQVDAFIDSVVELLQIEAQGL